MNSINIKRIGRIFLVFALIAGISFVIAGSGVQNGVKSLNYQLQSNDFYFQFFRMVNAGNNFAVAAQPSVDLVDSVSSKISPAVVSIFGSENINSVFRRSGFFASASAGSGFFVNSNGYILTNNHVINSPNFTYFVELQDGSKQPATIVFTDPAKDLAIVKIPGTNYPSLNLGDSSNIQVGEQVGGIGNAYGFAPGTISSGVVSGLNRSIIASDQQGDEQLSGLIRTTAQLYPGDSGGPLFDMNGNVIGIDVATSTDQQNVSFSIPINAAKSDILNVLGS